MTGKSVIISTQDMQVMAASIARSGLFGMNTPDQAMALMCIAQSEGRHPGVIARDYHIIQGKPSLKADAMLARFQEAGGKVKWNEYTAQRVEGEFSHPSGGTIVIDWDLEQARNAGLTSQTWKKYPRSMLRARVISEAIRTVFPGVLSGFYTPEEVEDFEPKENETNEPITPYYKDITEEKKDDLNARLEDYLRKKIFGNGTIEGVEETLKELEKEKWWNLNTLDVFNKIFKEFKEIHKEQEDEAE